MYEVYERLLKERGVKNSDVSKATGIPASTLSDWKKGRIKSLSMAKLWLIASYFNVSMEYMMTGEDDGTVEVPNIEVYEVSAGEGRSCSAPDSYKKEDGEYAKVVGDSMLPTLRNGDVVRIIETSTVEPSDYALVRINGDENTIKHAEVTKEGVWIRAENKEVFEDRFYSVEECLTVPVQIVGKAVEIVSRML